MRDISLHILDIVQNSIAAKATSISIYIDEYKSKDLFLLKVIDNGSGMDEKVVGKVTSPFFTTRSTRRVGFGLALLKMAAQRCGGFVDISSTIGVGTKVEAKFVLSHIDRPPLGRIDKTLATLIACNPKLEFTYSHSTDQGKFIFDTRIIKQRIDGISIAEPDVIGFIQKYLIEGIRNIDGGVVL